MNTCGGSVYTCYFYSQNAICKINYTVILLLSLSSRLSPDVTSLGRSFPPAPPPHRLPFSSGADDILCLPWLLNGPQSFVGLGTWLGLARVYDKLINVGFFASGPMQGQDGRK